MDEMLSKAEIQERMRKLKGTPVNDNGTLHYISNVTEDKIVIETQMEIVKKTACKGCKYLLRTNGWIGNEKPRKSMELPWCFSCKIGRFSLTHNPLGMPLECSTRNYHYDPQTEINNALDTIQDDIKKYKADKVVFISYGGYMEEIDIATRKLVGV